ncbi:hypothetical protein BCR34DRAFT_615286 [Clohesyomyces aquaticus]|uniref:F-box domain-containing protein n=1 Tax=Clohesyomyces aquaticus TaxID=1231657 RepID=A0A1Y1ZJC8_9PLEO|nr:hypothetical protein BCR34DRAFT_615286 [Clohesyomyces aquaticus]
MAARRSTTFPYLRLFMDEPVEPFPFSRLPHDVQFEVFKLLNLSTLLALVIASDRAAAVFSGCYISILKPFWEAWPSQTQHLVRTLLAVHQDLIHLDTNDPEDFFDAHVDGPATIFFSDPVRTLHLLHNITLDLELLPTMFARHALSNLEKLSRFSRVLCYCELENPLETRNFPPPNIELDDAELHRIQRAMLRFLLYSELFDQHAYGEHPQPIRRPFCTQFFARLAYFEFEELMAVEVFMRRLIENLRDRHGRGPVTPDQRFWDSAHSIRHFSSQDCKHSILLSYAQPLAPRELGPPRKLTTFIDWVAMAKLGGVSTSFFHAREPAVYWADSATADVISGGGNLQKRTVHNEERLCGSSIMWPLGLWYNTFGLCFWSDWRVSGLIGLSFTGDLNPKVHYGFEGIDGEDLAATYVSSWGEHRFGQWAAPEVIDATVQLEDRERVMGPAPWNSTKELHMFFETWGPYVAAVSA